MHDRHLIAVDAAVPVLVAAVIMAGLGLHGGASTRPTAIVVGLVAAAVLAGRRRWPGWTLAVSGGLVAVLFHLDRSAGSVAVLAPAVALYAVALRRGRRAQVAAGLTAVAAVLVVELVHRGRPTLGQTLTHTLLVAIPLLAAEVMRTHQANLKLFVERLELAEQAREREASRRVEQERMRIARDLHDVLAHTLTEVNVTAAAAAERVGTGEARSALERIESTSHAALGEIRAILGVLRGEEPTESSRSPAPGIDDIAELVSHARRSGLHARLDTAGSAPDRVCEATSVAAYRIAQESLTNVRRHAKGARVSVTIRYDPTRLTLTVDSDGETENDAPVPGAGITGMRERAETVGGHLDAGPVDTGFRVRAVLPYELTR